MQLFRTLSDAETTEFQQWARDNYTPFSPINGCWHPVIQRECCRINTAASGAVLPVQLPQFNA